MRLLVVYSYNSTISKNKLLAKTVNCNLCW